MIDILLGIVVLLVLLLSLLAVPVELAYRMNGAVPLDGAVRLRWLFGLVRFHIHFPNRTTPAEQKLKNRSVPFANPKNTKHKAKSRRLYSALKQPSFRRRLYKFLRDIISAIQVHELVLRVRIGLGDPADTGRLWAIVGPIAVLISNYSNTTVRIEPEFMESVADIHSHGSFRLIPLKFIALIIAFLLSSPILGIWRNEKT